MITRRHFMQSLIAATAASLGRVGRTFAMSAEQDFWFMPDEAEPHVCTWMAFAARPAVWGKRLVPTVQRNLAEIALAIAKYEPVRMLVRQADLPLAQQLLSTKVELIVCPLDDLWIRDSGPVFVVSEQGDKAGVDFNFNGWGEKQDFDQDAQVARFIAEQVGIERIQTDLIMEGGSIEVDGEGTALITESSVLNDNRNPGISKAECEEELKYLLGLEKIIWLPGIRNRDITDGHIDFYARFTQPGVVVALYEPDPYSFDHAVSKRHLEILKTATDAQGRRLEVVRLEAPTRLRNQFANHEFAASYINYSVCNGAVIAPEFGDRRADAAAKGTLQTLFPEREIVQLNIDGIAAGGGGIHCATLHEPSV